MQNLERGNERLQIEIAEPERVEAEVQQQANLLDLTHDSVFVCDVNELITCWNRGTAERYGWSREQALGKVSCQLKQTAFPAPLQDIEAELHRTGHVPDARHVPVRLRISWDPHDRTIVVLSASTSAPSGPTCP